MEKQLHLQWIIPSPKFGVERYPKDKYAFKQSSVVVIRSPLSTKTSSSGENNNNKKDIYLYFVQSISILLLLSFLSKDVYEKLIIEKRSALKINTRTA